MENSHQLIKKDRSQVFPKTFLDAIKSRETGASLQELLQGFNMYFVSYTGNASQTRNQVPTELRKKGLWLTYINFKNEVVTEWYDATDISNEAWGYDRNWRIASNRLVGDISISTNGNWVINGVESNIPARGETGITPILRVEHNKLQVTYNEGRKWEDVSDNFIYTRFRIHDNKLEQSTDLGQTWTVVSDYISTWFRWNNNTIQSTTDEATHQGSKNNWSDLSPKFEITLGIKGHVANISQLPSDVGVGTMYGVGTEGDYTIYVKDSGEWKLHGKLNEVANIVNTWGTSTTSGISQNFVTRNAAFQKDTDLREINVPSLPRIYKGATFVPALTQNEQGNSVISWTNDCNLENPTPVELHYDTILASEAQKNDLANRLQTKINQSTVAINTSKTTGVYAKSYSNYNLNNL